MDRSQQVGFLVEHAGNPRHKKVLEEADVVMPGGSPECGGHVTVYLKVAADGEGVENLSFTGEGDTISMGAASILMERVHSEGLTVQQILDLDYDAFVDVLGRGVIGSRTRNATLALGTLKSAVQAYRRDRRRETPADREASPVTAG